MKDIIMHKILTLLIAISACAPLMGKPPYFFPPQTITPLSQTPPPYVTPVPPSYVTPPAYNPQAEDNDAQIARDAQLAEYINAVTQRLQRMSPHYPPISDHLEAHLPQNKWQLPQSK